MGGGGVNDGHTGVKGPTLFTGSSRASASNGGSGGDDLPSQGGGTETTKSGGEAQGGGRDTERFLNQ